MRRKTVVVAHAPGAVLMPWAASVPSIVCAFMPGQVTSNNTRKILDIVSCFLVSIIYCNLINEIFFCY